MDEKDLTVRIYKASHTDDDIMGGQARNVGWSSALSLIVFGWRSEVLALFLKVQFHRADFTWPV